MFDKPTIQLILPKFIPLIIKCCYCKFCYGNLQKLGLFKVKYQDVRFCDCHKNKNHR